MKALGFTSFYRKCLCNFRLPKQREHLRRNLNAKSEKANRQIGLAVITYNRLDFLKRSVSTLDQVNWGNAQQKLIVDDGSLEAGYESYLAECSSRGIGVIRNEKNSGVAVTKNRALKYLIEMGCKHLFLIEDDILMNSRHTLNQYIDYAEDAGLQHMNYALHGELNRGNEMLYRKDQKDILCYPHLTGAFSYYTKEAIEKTGFMDENFHNAMEHIDHTFRLASAGYTLPFWYFADHPLNCDFFEEQPQALEKSVIRQGDWQKKTRQAESYWISKHGCWPPPRPE